MKKRIVILSFLLNCAFGAPVEVNRISDAKLKLKNLDNKITLLEQSLHLVHNEQDTVNQKLAKTEMEMSNTTKQLNLIESNILEKKQQIQTLNQLSNTLTTQLNTQHILLAKHLRSRYKMGSNKLMQWPLSQKNTEDVSHMLAFYRYLVKARQNTIHQVSETKTRLSLNQQKLNQETNQLKLLENQVISHQKQLELSKRYHAVLLDKLSEDIKTKQQTMRDYQHDKDSLSKLMHSLAVKGLTERRYPFMQKHRHLTKPIADALAFEKINQGILFLAPEGTPITAVQSGKVVFSDWLNGYGQILILDHGAGYMSVYAHNQSLIKQKGDIVLKGEKIATVGHSGSIAKNGLYFEMRIGGKAVPPREWLD